jgi:flagellar basal-body rod protein FlgC
MRIDPQTPRPLRNLFSALSRPAAGMSIQQSFMEVIAENIRNAATTRTAEGGPYRRQIAVAEGGVRTQTFKDASEGRLVYMPGHPDADQDGLVRMPNVDVDSERADLLIAQRLHEANATVFQVAKNMLKRAIDI